MIAQPQPSRRVLVVEDEALVALALAEFLRRGGHAVIGPAPSVAAALALLAGLPPPEVAIIDVQLRGETGYAVAAALRARAIPFVFLTGYGTGGISADWHDAACLSKPCRPSVLLATMAALLQPRTRDRIRYAGT